MHDARTVDSADAGERVAAVIEQGVYERAGIVAGRGVHHHARGLVDDYYVVVLVDDVERNILGQSIERLGLGEREVDEVTHGYLVFFLGRPSVDGDEACFTQLCRRTARHIKILGNIRVEPCSAILFYGMRHFFLPAAISFFRSRISASMSSPAPTQTKESAPLKTAKLMSRKSMKSTT